MLQYKGKKEKCHLNIDTKIVYSNPSWIPSTTSPLNAFNTASHFLICRTSAFVHRYIVEETDSWFSLGNYGKTHWPVYALAITPCMVPGQVDEKFLFLGKGLLGDISWDADERVRALQASWDAGARTEAALVCSVLAQEFPVGYLLMKVVHLTQESLIIT